MVGSAAITAMVLPQLLAQVQVPLPAPLWVISLAGLAQGALVLALAVWAGVRLAPSVGLRAPAFEAVVTGRPIGPALRSQLLSGLIAGVLGGILLFAAFRYAPGAVAELQDRFTIPIFARVLYGGVTEELLLRWGLMTALVWLAWRLCNSGTGLCRDAARARRHRVANALEFNEGRGPHVHSEAQPVGGRRDRERLHTCSLLSKPEAGDDLGGPGGSFLIHLREPLEQLPREIGVKIRKPARAKEAALVIVG